MSASSGRRATQPALLKASSARNRRPAGGAYSPGRVANSRSSPTKQHGASTARAYSANSARTAATCVACVAWTILAIYYSSMRLHQLKVDYDAEQDRLLMLVATSEGVELRLALTRRFVKLLWPLLVKPAAEAGPPHRPEAQPGG